MVQRGAMIDVIEIRVIDRLTGTNSVSKTSLDHCC